MKKLFTLCCALFLGFTAANAQVTVQGSKFLDNWSVGVAGGVYTPMANHAFFGSMRPTVNLTIAKQITPIYGLGVEGATIFNGTKVTGLHSNNAFDGVTVHLLNYVNLNNLFCGYKGAPRFFEVVAKGGLGWGHEFMAVDGARNNSDYDFISAKAGLDFNFNLGAAKAWQINIKPAVVWNLEGGHYHGDKLSSSAANFGNTNTYQEARYNSGKNNINHAAFEITAGVTYKFNNSYGAHNFVTAKLYDQAEVDGLNAKINDLRSSLNNKDNELNNANNRIKSLQDQLNDCRNKKPETVTKTVYDGGSMVSFRQGKSTIDASQYANVERVASYLKNHKNAKVKVEGYASPEGSKAINEALAKKRAEAVKNMLVKKYKIAANRIDATGKGVGNMFSEPDWNRVAISTIAK